MATGANYSRRWQESRVGFPEGRDDQMRLRKVAAETDVAQLDCDFSQAETLR
jgi:hypothetical protein